mmetsp:Transcript_30997/g.34691  ORF Transcript_30997/g.34691 Transcript_30997/m.34691 type:complete len:153 (-) Transcript_30997:34-492(-)
MARLPSIFHTDRETDIDRPRDSENEKNWLLWKKKEGKKKDKKLCARRTTVIPKKKKQRETGWMIDEHHCSLPVFSLSLFVKGLDCTTRRDETRLTRLTLLLLWMLDLPCHCVSKLKPVPIRQLSCFVAGRWCGGLWMRWSRVTRSLFARRDL